MKEMDLIKSEISRIQGMLDAEALKALNGNLIDEAAIEEQLKMMTNYVAPAYLPFVECDGDLFAFHLWPGRSLEQSPVVYISHSGMETHFVCKNIADFPIGLWLWVGKYFSNRKHILKLAVDQLAKSIPGGREVPATLWALYDQMQGDLSTRWRYECSSVVEQAWLLADVGHPFVGMPRFSDEALTSEVLPVIEQYVRLNPEPEILGLFLAVQLKANIPLDREEVLALFSAEAWRETDSLVRMANWKTNGSGMGTWNCLLKNISSPEVFKDSPLELLMESPKLYWGKDRNGPLILARIANHFYEAGECGSALCQIRNATTLAMLALGSYPRELAVMMVKICEQIEKESLAGAVAYVSGHN